MPRGYDKNDKAAERFLYKSRFIDHKLNDKEVCDKNFVKKIVALYKIVQPFNDFLDRGL
jgi:hypothetical protein